jgi:hypothetical protein
VPFLVGGEYALAHYTGIIRHTKDFDIFVYPHHCAYTLEVLYTTGYYTELTFPHWLGNQWALQPWGEAITKQFVHEAVNEAVELESALAKLRTPQRIVVLHYSPIRDTVVGEPPEIFAFLGSSRLEEPLNRYAVTAVFHGHAHHGTPEGQTTGGASLQCRSAATPQDVSRPPFRLIEIPMTPQ